MIRPYFEDLRAGHPVNGCICPRHGDENGDLLEVGPLPRGMEQNWRRLAEHGLKLKPLDDETHILKHVPMPSRI